MKLVIALVASMFIGSAYGFGYNPPSSDGQDQSQRQSQGQNQGQLQGQGQKQSNHSSNRNSNRNSNHNSSNSNSRSTGVGIGVGVSYSEGSEAASGSLSGASSDNSVSISQTYEQEDNIRIKNTPDAYAPALTTSNGTCMGSVSAGGSGPGLGLSFGTTVKDESCNLRYNAEIINNMGFPKVAMKIMCQEPTVAKAAPELCGVKAKVKSDNTDNGFF